MTLKVTEQSKAAAGDLRLGDVIVSINGESTAEMLNVEAQNKIKQSSGQLQLLVDRWVPKPCSHELSTCSWGFSSVHLGLGMRSL